jgi:hypothetical protein
MPMIRTVSGAVVGVCVAVASAASAQTPARTTPAPQVQSPAVTPEVAPVSDLDARATREELRQLMSRFPPDLARVLKLDPSLLQSQQYLAQYPTLAAFIARHPEIVHNPRFYLDFVRDSYDWNEPVDARTQTLGIWRNMFEAIQVFGIFLTVSILIGWFVRTFIDYRRWLRVSRIQTEVHNKLLERFSGTGELLAYIQSPAGRKFLESAPIPLDPGPRSIAAPFARILWSVQAGVVLAVLGLGVQLVSAQITEDVSQPVGFVGVLLMALGIGFVLSAGVSYFMSRRLGLLEPLTPTAPERSETSIG